jgi:hypothetical protein
MTFTKNVENFVCEKCGTTNIGNGFTNHCKKCLWSKHVDIDPGDRREVCGGMMEPVETGSKNQELRIKQRCQKCGFERWAPIIKEDNFEAVIDLQKRNANELR